MLDIVILSLTTGRIVPDLLYHFLYCKPYIDYDTRVHLIFFVLSWWKYNFGHESRDYYVTVDHIEFIQNTSLSSIYYHNQAMKFK
jgi:hypothetical protein